MDLDKYFRIADQNLNCNTAYPVYKAAYKKYMTEADIMAGETGLSFYVHIPFCEHLCRFCEYTRFLSGNDQAERLYLDMLSGQIAEYLDTHSVRTIYGFDIGGGTPTALSNENFRYLMDITDFLVQCGNSPADFEKSAEFSFSTITESKLQLLYAHGFQRISTGIQSANYALMHSLNRATNDLQYMRNVCAQAREIGIQKVNIDLMYGLPGQTDTMIDETIRVIDQLMPEHVTLYETRFNRSGIRHPDIDRNVQYLQYRRFYNGLTALGYAGRFGNNTFTRCKDHGVSSYLYHRMREMIPYKGFGVSSQSMSHTGLSYGSYKNSGETVLPKLERIGLDFNYSLPTRELAAKYISIAMYSASFRMDVLRSILEEDPECVFHNEFRYLKERELIELQGDDVFLTESGFRYYGAITALFWSDEQKQCLLADMGEIME